MANQFSKGAHDPNTRLASVLGVWRLHEYAYKNMQDMYFPFPELTNESLQKIVQRTYDIITCTLYLYICSHFSHRKGVLRSLALVLNFICEAEPASSFSRFILDISSARCTRHLTGKNSNFSSNACSSNHVGLRRLQTVPRSFGII